MLIDVEHYDMTERDPSSSQPPKFIINRIIDRLETHGIDSGDFVLYDVVDPDELIALVDAGDATEDITFDLLGLTVTVYGTGDVNIETHNW